MSLYITLAFTSLLAALVLRGAWRHIVKLRHMSPEDRSAALAVDWRYWPLVGAVCALVVFALFEFSTIGTIAFAFGALCVAVEAAIVLVDYRKTAAQTE